MSTETTAMDINTWLDTEDKAPVTLTIGAHTIRLTFIPKRAFQVQVTPPVTYRLWMFKSINATPPERVIDTEEYDSLGDLVLGLGRIMTAMAWEVEATQ